MNIYNGKHNSAEIIIGIRKLFITILTTLFKELSYVYRAYERTDTGIAANIAAKIMQLMYSESIIMLICFGVAPIMYSY